MMPVLIGAVQIAASKHSSWPISRFLGDGLGCVRVRTNLCSGPAPPGKTVEVRLYPSHFEVLDEGRCIALHERCYERHQKCSTSNIISMCWSASRARWRVPSPWRRGGKEGCGRKVTIGYSS